MPDITRREFLKTSTKLAVLMGLGSSVIPDITSALEDISSGNAPILWLQAQSCSGCSVSFLNSEDPEPARILTKYISLLFHPTLSVCTGHLSMEVINRSIKQGEYVLIIEGSIPEAMPEACMVGHRPINELVLDAAKNANIVIAFGTCAAFGGIPMAENNPTGAVSVPEFLKNQGITKPIVTIPGCPAHPDWLVGSLVHVLKFGIPDLDKMGRPKMFFSKLVHDQCPRFADYERENFAKSFSDEGCLFKLGCLGINTYADCTIRYWNSRTNSCIQAGAPCIGCASEDFAINPLIPFYRKGEKRR
ncbi:Periplasmic (NiFeSe) hydrogenase small subunit [Candidatus Magnetomoraceae bacterium gMMP-15]